jgi:hypothetical protein
MDDESFQGRWTSGQNQVSDESLAAAYIINVDSIPQFTVSGNIVV